MRATAGSSHRPPVLGGSASMAIPPSVTHVVRDSSSLAATPLTHVRVLPPISSHPSLLGSSAGSLSTVSTAPIPSAAAVPVPAPLPAPVGPTPLPVDRFTLPAINSGNDYLQTQELILFWLCSPGFSIGRPDSALITDTTNSLAEEGFHEFRACFQCHLHDLSQSAISIPPILQAMLFLRALHPRYKSIIDLFASAPVVMLY